MSAPCMSAEMEVRVPDCEHGLGRLVLAPDSPHIIDGVRITPWQLWPDDRGYFLEVLRAGEGPVAAFDPSSTQISAALNYPGAIKAFHFHRFQTDFWTPVQGMFQIALIDMRPASSTFGRKNTIYAGVLRPWSVLIPPGVAHGYKVVGDTPALLVYATDKFYNPDDEGRIPYTDPRLAYDWELQHK